MSQEFVRVFLNLIFDWIFGCQRYGQWQRHWRWILARAVAGLHRSVRLPHLALPGQTKHLWSPQQRHMVQLRILHGLDVYFGWRRPPSPSATVNGLPVFT